MTTNFSEKQIQEMQDQLWWDFINPDGAGVKVEDVMTGAKFVGVIFTEEQINSVAAHQMVPDKWTKGDEAVKDMIADATDSTNGEKLYQWLAWVVGDQTADDMLEDWK